MSPFRLGQSNCRDRWLDKRRRAAHLECLEQRSLLAVAPVATDDLIEVQEDVANVITAFAGVLRNDSDADGDSLTAAIVQKPRHGEFLLLPDGGFSYSPRPDFWGVDSFTYRASDGTLLSNLALVTLLVLASNDAPTGTPDEYSVDVGGNLSVLGASRLTLNDIDPDGDVLTSVLDSTTAHGTLALAPNGAFEYAPTAGFHGVDSFTYRSSDGEFMSTPTLVRLVVNTLPAASADQYSLIEDQSFQLAAPGLLANDADVDLDTLSAHLVARPTHGDVLVKADGSFVYSPLPDFYGSDAFTYRVFDGYHYTSPINVALQVAPVLDPPAPQSDHYVVTQGTSVRAPFAQNTGVLQTLVRTAAVATSDLLYDPTRGVLYASAVADGTHDDRIVTIDPNTGAVKDLVAIGNGPGRLAISDDGSYLYVAIDADNALSRVNLATGLVDLTIQLGAQYVEDLAALPGQPQSVAVALGDRDFFPSHQTIAVYDDDVRRPVEYLDTRGGNVLAVGASAGVLYSFNTQTSEYQLRTLAIGADGVTLVDTAFQLLSGANVDMEAQGDRIFSTTGRVVSPSSRSVVANLGINGPVELDPALNRAFYLAGDGASRALRAYDMTTLSQAGTVNLAQASGPISSLTRFGSQGLAFRTANAVYLVDSTLVSSFQAFGTLANDLPAEATQVTAALATPPAHGPLQMNADGTFYYRPDAGFVGTDTFQYELRSANFAPVVASVTIEVLPANAPPVSTDEVYAVNEDQVLTIGASGVLANDSDADGSALVARLVSQPAHGSLTLEANGAFRYEPAENYFGPDHFSYQAFDGARYSHVATVTLDVIAVNDVPMAESDHYELDRGGALIADLDAAPEDALLAVRQLPFAASLLSYDAHRGLIYASVPPSEPDGNSIIAIDPETSQTVKRVALGGTGNAAAISGDGQYLYFSLNAAERVRRLKLDSFTVDTAFEIVANSVSALAVMPGQPDTIAVGQYSTCCGGQDGVQIFDHGVPRPLRDHQRISGMSFDDTGSRLFVTGYSNDFMIYDVAPAGLVYRQSDSNLVSGGFTLRDGLIYTSYGLVADPYRMLPVGQYSGLSGYGSVLPMPERNMALAVLATSSPNYAADVIAYDLDSFLEIGRVRVSGVYEYLTGVLPWGENGVAFSTTSGQLFFVQTSLIPPAHGARLTANDGDVEGQPLTTVLTVPPAHGVLAMDADGSFAYTPDLDFAGEDEFFYRLSDGAANSSPARVTIHVRPKSLPPRANDDSYVTAEDAPLTVQASGGLLANDTGLNGSELLARLAIPPIHGDLTLGQNGAFVYEPQADWFGGDRFAYRAVDGVNDSLLTWVHLTVVAVNDPVHVAGEDYRTPSGQELLIDRSAFADAWDATEFLVHDRERIVRYRAASGAFLGEFASLTNVRASADTRMTFGPDGNLYVTSFEDRVVHRYDGSTGAYLGEFTQGFLLSSPLSIVFTPGGDLLVADFGTGQVVRFDGKTGGYVGRFDQGADYANPIDLAIGPDGVLYVASHTYNRVLKFDIATGSYAGDAHEGILLDRPLSIAVAPNGDLYVATQSRTILHYDARTKALLNYFGETHLENAVDLSFGLDGNLYVADSQFGVKKFDAVSGQYLGLAVSLGSSTVSFVIDPNSVPPVGVLANDRDAEQDALTLQLSRPPRFGQLNLNADGTFRYLPNAGFEGVDTFEYRVHDGTSLSLRAMVRIQVGKGSTQLRGDANRDGAVDVVDLNLVRNNFGLIGAQVPGDANSDGQVDVQDLNDVRNNFGVVAGLLAPGLQEIPRGTENNAPPDSPRMDRAALSRIDLRAWDASVADLAEDFALRPAGKWRSRKRK